MQGRRRAPRHREVALGSRRARFLRGARTLLSPHHGAEVFTLPRCLGDVKRLRLVGSRSLRPPCSHRLHLFSTVRTIATVSIDIPLLRLRRPRPGVATVTKKNRHLRSDMR